MSSEAAQKACPDEPVADGVMRVSRESHRAAFDRGAVEALRQAAEVCARIQDDEEFPNPGMGVRAARIVIEAMADEWEVGQ